MKKTPILVQLDSDDKAKIEQLADEWRMSLSGTIRRVVKDYLEKIAPPTPEPPLVPVKKYYPGGDPDNW